MSKLIRHRLGNLAEEKYEDLVKQACRLLRNYSDAEDAVQDAFLDLLKRCENPNRKPVPTEHEKLEGLARSLVRYAALTLLRRARRKRSPLSNCEPWRLEIGHDPRPLDTLATTQQLRRLRKAISSLSDEDAGLLRLRMDGLSLRDICNQRGLRCSPRALGYRFDRIYVAVMSRYAKV